MELVLNSPVLSCCGRSRGECRCELATNAESWVELAIAKSQEQVFSTDRLDLPDPVVNTCGKVIDRDPEGPLLPRTSTLFDNLGFKDGSNRHLSTNEAGNAIGYPVL